MQNKFLLRRVGDFSFLNSFYISDPILATKGYRILEMFLLFFCKSKSIFKSIKNLSKAAKVSRICV